MPRYIRMNNFMIWREEIPGNSEIRGDMCRIYRRLLRNSNKRSTRRGNKPKFVRCYFSRSASENMFIGRVAGRGRGKSCRAASWTRRASESVVAVRQFEKTGWSIERNCLLLGAAVCGGFKKPRTPRSWQRHENRHAKNKTARRIISSRL